MKTQLDMDKIARGLGAERRGTVTSTGGYFGAMQLIADVEARFRVPAGGGRRTDPRWTERRLLPLAPKTLKRLEEQARSAFNVAQPELMRGVNKGVVHRNTAARRLSRLSARIKTLPE